MEYGQIYATAGVAAAMEESAQFTAEIAAAFARYQRGDWGQLCREVIITDRDELDKQIENGFKDVGEQIKRILLSKDTVGA